MNYKLGLFAFISIFFFAFDLPKDWFIAGDKPASYEIGIVENEGVNRSNAASIKSVETKIEGFGTLMQHCAPDKFLGKRICMKGMLKTQNVTEWAGLWLRIDTEKPMDFAFFDNLHDGKMDRSVTGTTGWTEYEIVLDVPENATKISYGALLTGTGQIWVDNFSFEIVNESKETTGKILTSAAVNKTAETKKPTNLNFEE